MAQHNDLGKLGEDLAADFLIKNGYKILDRNWRYRKAEIDIIAKKDNILAIVEVKTRSSLDFGKPEESINKKKINLLVEATNVYVNEKDIDANVRFDIISIYKTTIKCDIHHIKDAFLFF